MAAFSRVACSRWPERTHDGCRASWLLSTPPSSGELVETAVSYTHHIYSSMAEVDLQAWEAVRAAEGEIFTDPRFISAVEAAMGADTRCWPVLVRDEMEQPVAVTCLSLYRVDGALLTGPRLKRIVQAIRRAWSGYLFFRILFCGLPVSAGQTPICFAPQADPGKATEAIEAAVSELATRFRVRLIVWREFSPDDCQWLAPLEDRGYIRADSLPMCHFEPRFADFDEYCGALRWKLRYNILRSRRKLEEAGLRIVRMHGDEGFDRLYTETSHELYEAVRDRSAFQLERLPAEFFREIARRLGKDARFSLVFRETKIVAFLCSLADRRQFHLLFLGMDYSVNAECDLYFNVMYDGLDWALRSGVNDICVGQTSYAFKGRLGCRFAPRVFFIKGTGLLRWPLRLFAGVLFRLPPMPSPPRVFRTGESGE
ncbi:MAG: GNAT family N-acetyltransferase [Patescibacteria group bacterium]|nr:GNAT family N-acetyltransferase [Patescibacteria group bacterium]